MTDEPKDRKAILRELYRRKRCQESYHSFCLNIDIPTNPTPASKPDETLMGPASGLMAKHHAAIIAILERTVKRFMGRCMIFAPPGTAKSSYTSVALPAWYFGNNPGHRIIMTSYAAELAEKHSRRIHQILKQDNYQEIWENAPQIGDTSAAGNWSTTTQNEMLACGILGGVTGNRANGIIIDDPVKNREEADSPATQAKIVSEYNDSIVTRLLPGAWMAFIMTRWQENDLAGSILPDDYKGQSGMVKCKDGLWWEVLNLPAKAENADDPLGRAFGEYIWPEYYPVEHWQMFENATGTDAARTWASLYQQRPTAQGSGKFTRVMFDPYKYDPDDLPIALTLIGAGDYAVTDGGGDWTELAIWGMDSNSTLWALEWWSAQCDTGVSVEKMLEMIERRKVRIWFNEGGTIDKAMRPAFQRRSRELMSPGKHFCPDDDGVPQICHKTHDVYCDLRSLPSMRDKIAKAMNFQARASLGQVRFPRNAAWTEQAILQLLSLPAGRHDDKVDVCGLVGRGVDQYHPARVVVPEEREVIKPFTPAWLEFVDPGEQKIPRYR